MTLLEAATVSGLLGDVGTIAGIAAALASALLAGLVLSQGRTISSLRKDLLDESERAALAESALAAELASVGRVATPAPAAASEATVAEDVSPEPQAASAQAGHVGSSQGMPALGSATASNAVAVLIARRSSPVTTPAEPDKPLDAAAPAAVVIPAPAAPAVASVPVANTDAAAVRLGEPSTAAAGGLSRPPRPPVKPAGPPRRSRIPLLLGAVIVIGLAVFAVSQLTGGSDSPAPKPAVITTPEKPGADVVVAVLNGTPVSGLAGQVARELARDGFRKGRVATARDQQQSRTVVGYLPGHLTDAEAVTQTLGIKDPPVPADETSQAVACPEPTACNVMVIVTVGSDRAR